MKYARRKMTEDNAHDNAEGDPYCEITFEQGHWRFPMLWRRAHDRRSPVRRLLS